MLNGREPYRLTLVVLGVVLHLKGDARMRLVHLHRQSVLHMLDREILRNIHIVRR